MRGSGTITGGIPHRRDMFREPGTYPFLVEHYAGNRIGNQQMHATPDYYHLVRKDLRSATVSPRDQEHSRASTDPRLVRADWLWDRPSTHNTHNVQQGLDRGARA